METDRVAVLTIRAAVRGAVDFSKARPLDPRWWRRLRLILTELGRQDDLEQARVSMALPAAQAASGVLEGDGFRQAQERLMALTQEARACLWPWTGRPDQARQRVADELADVYRRTVGDPRDPVFAAKLQADVDAVEARLRAPRAESDEQRVDRLLRDRDARRR